MNAFTVTEGLRRRVLALLFVVAFLNYLDRNVIGILMPAIKRELALSDTEIGFITGIAYSLFYAVMGVPIARLADRVPRRNVIAVAMAVWSAMTAACGLAANFWQLSLARIMVGVGEAGATPSSHSLIADLFEKSRRATALAVYALGSGVALLVGLFAAGWITETLGWRTAVIVIGAPGILVAILIARALPDPPRGFADGRAPVPQPPFWPTVRLLLSRSTFVHNSIGAGLYAAMYFGFLSWLPSFFSRSHHLGIATIGAWLSGVFGASQIVGTILGGVVGDRLARGDMRWLMWLCSLVTISAVPFFFLAFQTSSTALAFFALVLPILLSVMQSGPQHATTQGVAPPATRATASAVYLLIVSLIGGLGPQFIGLLSDALTPSLGEAALGRSILIVASVCCVWSAVHFWLAGRRLIEDFARA